jgi:hypothetical protein
MLSTVNDVDEGEGADASSQFLSEKYNLNYLEFIFFLSKLCIHNTTGPIGISHYRVRKLSKGNALAAPSKLNTTFLEELIKQFQCDSSIQPTEITNRFSNVNTQQRKFQV